MIPAGASYDRRIANDPRYVNAYNFVHLDFETKQGTIYLRRWSDRQSKWLADVDAYDNGRLKFRIPKVSGHPPSKDQITADMLRLQQNSSHANRGERLHAILADHSGFMRDRLESFVGRQTELAEIRQRIAEKMTTGGYVTITGQAGQGKE